MARTTEYTESKSSSGFFSNDLDTKTVQGAIEDLQKAALTEVYEWRAKKEEELAETYSEAHIRDEKKAQKTLAQTKQAVEKQFMAKELKDRQEAEKKLAQEKYEAEKALRQALVNSNIADIQETYREATGEEISRLQAAGLKAQAIVKDISDPGGAINQSLNSALSKMADKLGSGITEAVNLYSSYQGKINARLDGTQKTFKQFMDASDKMSPFYKVTDYAKKLDELVDAGVAYNVEQRAFLATISDKVVSTFEVNNATLMRIIRMQASDSTAIRMGMEASLNEYLNVMYRNTEYLKNTYDNVTSALVEAEATMGSAESSAEFEYIVQKWLGSLTSTGMSENTATQIAAAIGQLGSGDISMLGTGVGNLVTMAAARAGMSIGEMLTGGINGNTTDQLMASLVEFMQEWGASTNNVVRSQIAGLFGVNVSDLISSLNLNTSNVVGTSVTSNQALSKLSGKMSNGFSYGAIMSGNGAVTVAEAVNNMLSNAVLSMGNALVDNGYQYLTYRAAEIVGDMTKSMADYSVTANIINRVASGVKIASLVGAGIENLYDLTKGTASWGFNIIDTFNRLGDLTMGANYSGQSYSAKVTSGGQIQLTQSGSTDVESVKVQAQEDTEAERKLAQAPLEIQQYLLNTFDQKFDALVRLTAASANYSMRDQYGARIGDNVIESLLGTSSVRIVAEPADTTQIDLTTQISTNVANIYGLLQRVVNGETSVAVRAANAVSLAASRYGEASDYITSVVMG